MDSSKMKTNQPMIRKIDGYEVIQRTADGYYDANSLLMCWNGKHDNVKKKMANFLDNSSTVEFMKSLKEDLNKGRNPSEKVIEPVISVASRKSKTGPTKAQVWMNEIAFLKFAAWLNPSFEVEVFKFARDGMISLREDACYWYKQLSSVLMKKLLVGLPKEEQQEKLKRVSRGINMICFNAKGDMERNNHGVASEQKILVEWEKRLIHLIEDGFIVTYDALITYMLRKYKERYEKLPF